MITKVTMASSTMRYIQKLLKDFEQAAIDKSWKGSMHPDDWDDVEKNYKDAKKKLVRYIGSKIQRRFYV